MNIEKMYERSDVQQLVRAMLLLDDEDDVRAFLTDLCTPREICDFGQRLQVARFLDEGEPYVEVQARTGASSTTVSRVSKALNGEHGGYRRVLIKLEDQERGRT
ncbi:YerC/YecD family TrpR-related protein [Collinsella tanakaei]|uniref:YerC/YecD family TrpR-related protein n=1 Tax=Collinsella tanakaei TaxID=626935 RepID=UPI0025A45428|nr:YerC/YecD family TrpR-related protein [Collinsella tanakaei]MDM8300015.1 YerC/YecD family TrpR-related protein [Collinsella tanakaei]